MGREFIKTAPAAALPRFEAEVAGLATLRTAGALRVPEVIACGLDGSQARLVLEYFDLCGLDRSSGAALGRALATLHRTLGQEFGVEKDNFIGATPQINTPHRNWARFFADCRLKPQLDWALENGMERGVVERGRDVAARLGAFFVDYTPGPSLLHGDLWSGNADALTNGTPVIFDPAVYYGDREADLAMAELFGGFPESFFAAYREAWPLDPGFETRKTLYNLYHILNHYNLFGPSYQGQAKRMIERLLADLRG